MWDHAYPKFKGEVDVNMEFGIPPSPRPPRFDDLLLWFQFSYPDFPDTPDGFRIGG